MKLLKKIQYHLVIYKEFVRTCFIQAMAFRTHFVLLIIMDLFYYASTIASIDIIYNHVEQIGTWNRNQLMFFVSFMLLVDNMHMSFLANNYWRLSLLIRTGELDFLLVKPASSLFSVYLRYLQPGSMTIFFIPVGFIIYFGIQLGFSWSVWIILPFLIVLAFILTGLIETIIACGMFWMIEGTGINFLRMQLQQVSRWPDFIYSGFIRKILTFVIPILLIFNAPNRFIFDHTDWWPLAGMIAAIAIAWTILQVVWKFCLDSYESASS